MSVEERFRAWLKRFEGWRVGDFLALEDETVERLDGTGEGPYTLCLSRTDLSGDFDPAARAVELEFVLTAGDGRRLVHEALLSENERFRRPDTNREER